MQTRGGVEAETHQFGTMTGKFELAFHHPRRAGIYDLLPRYEEPPQTPVSTPAMAEQYPLILTTGHRVRRYWMIEWRQIQSVREGAPDPIVQIHPQCALELDIAGGEWVG